MSEEKTLELEELIEKESGFLWGLALTFTKNKFEDAEDLLQETLMKVFKGFHGFKQDSNFRAWARKIMLNTHLNEIRKNNVFEVHVDNDYADSLQASVNSEELFSTAAVSRSPEAEFMAREIDGDIMEIFYSLEDEYRHPFALYHFEGFSYKQLSKALDVPMGTVKSRIFRARQMLKDMLDERSLEKAANA